jgi:hypothetical protein
MSETRQPITHELKTWHIYFQAIWDGLRLFEYRKNDRDYRVGDILWLREFDISNNKYTGREIKRKVLYVFDDPGFVQEGWVIISISPEPQRVTDEEMDGEREKFKIAWSLAKEYQSTWKGHSQQEQYDFVNGAVAMFDHISPKVEVTDEEIDIYIAKNGAPVKTIMSEFCDAGFRSGAKWMRELTKTK